MSQTNLSIQGKRFLINGQLTYAEIQGSRPSVHGLLMNARFIQGIFDDRAAPERFARWGHAVWDATAQTERLVRGRDKLNARQGAPQTLYDLHLPGRVQVRADFVEQDDALGLQNRKRLRGETPQPEE